MRAAGFSAIDDLSVDADTKKHLRQIHEMFENEADAIDDHALDSQQLMDVVRALDERREKLERELLGEEYEAFFRQRRELMRRVVREQHDPVMDVIESEFLEVAP